MIVTSFSDFHQGLEDCPKRLKGKSRHKWLLHNLKNRTRISCFEIDSDMDVCMSLMYLKKIGKISMNGKDTPYPYVGIELRGRDY